MAAATQRDPLACGKCGGKTFKLDHIKPTEATRVGGGGILQGYLTATCTKCKAQTAIRVQASLDIDGSLCGGWGKP